MLITAKVWNLILTYNTKDKSLQVNDGKIYSFQDMKEYSESYKGCNRIYKPFVLLFWSDCKNGKSSNWETTKTEIN